MELYFTSASAISPILSFGQDKFALESPASKSDYLRCIEPDYKEVIDRRKLRRMSRFIKMSVANANRCLSDAGVGIPDAIITATALGCVADTVDFLKQIKDRVESMLNPTPFMQSTHNTASGQIALLLGCKNQNITFSQKNISFESALLHTQMMLMQGNNTHVLIGGSDEITDDSFQLLTQTGCFQSGEGTGNAFLPGEGSAFFILSNQPSKQNLAKLCGISIFSEEISTKPFNDFITGFLFKNGLTSEKIDVLLTGTNPSGIPTKVLSEIFKNVPTVRFKNFCGEYDTSSVFAVWLAIKIINENIVNNPSRNPNNILIHNEGSGPYHSLILVSSC